MENDNFLEIAEKMHKQNFSKWHEEKDIENSEYLRDRFDSMDYEQVIAWVTNKIHSSELKRKLLKEYSAEKEKSVKELKSIQKDLQDKIDELIHKEKRNAKKARALVWASVSMAIITTL